VFNTRRIKYDLYNKSHSHESHLVRVPPHASCIVYKLLFKNIFLVYSWLKAFVQRFLQELNVVARAEAGVAIAAAFYGKHGHMFSVKGSCQLVLC